MSHFTEREPRSSIRLDHPALPHPFFAPLPLLPFCLPLPYVTLFGTHWKQALIAKRTSFFGSIFFGLEFILIT